MSANHRKGTSVLSSMTATKTFNLSSQREFAELSGDFNPMHLDAVAARRFLFGEVVVHGVNLLLSALEFFASATSEFASLEYVEVEFRAPVTLGVEVCFQIEFESERVALLSAVANETTVMKARVKWSSNGRAVQALPQQVANWNTEPRELDREHMHDLTGEEHLILDPHLFASLFPSLPIEAMADQVATLLASTRVVGMRCPGYHSIYSQLSMQFDTVTDGPRGLSYELEDFDERFNLAAVGMSSSQATGQAKAFLRPKPQKQPSIEEVAPHVRSGEFAGRRALVIGGSRGLGELCAKVLAAGGADVVITYRSGREEAGSVCGDIAQTGAAAKAIKFDAGGEIVDLQKLAIEWRPTDLLYFATPTINKADTRFFNESVFRRFADVYVRGFSETAEVVLSAGSLQTIVYPSSVALEDLTKGMMEYSAAKAAGEKICDYIARRNKGIRVITPRLPRMATDQTASVLSSAACAAITYFVGMLRQN